MAGNVPRTPEYIIDFLSGTFQISRNDAEKTLLFKPKTESLGQQLRLFKKMVNNSAIIAGLPGGEAVLQLVLADHKKTLEQTKDIYREFTTLPSSVQDILTISVKAEIQSLWLEAEALDIEMRSKLQSLRPVGAEAGGSKETIAIDEGIASSRDS